MSLRISVDLDGLRWADLYRFVDLARGGGVSPEEPVDILTFGSEAIPASLSAKIHPGQVPAGPPPGPPGPPPGPPEQLPARAPGGSPNGHFNPFDRPGPREPIGMREPVGMREPIGVREPIDRPPVDYTDEFARLQEGLVRPVRRGGNDDGPPDRP